MKINEEFQLLHEEQRFIHTHTAFMHIYFQYSHKIRKHKMTKRTRIFCFCSFNFQELLWDIILDSFRIISEYYFKGLFLLKRIRSW